MKIRILLYLLLSLTLCYGQGNIFKRWFFGTNAGLNFNGGPTNLSGGQAGGGEGGASIADASGNLLFYTDGLTVWDRNHNSMPNADYWGAGNGLTGDWDGTQGSLIVQRPGSASLYYVFICPSFAGAATGLKYSIVDMALNSGNGNVNATKNVTFPTLPAGLITSEKMTAIRHCNGTDWWIVTHDLTAGGSNTFRAWRFSSAGLSGMVTSTAGSTFTTAGQQAIGWMVGNNAGSKLALACYNKQTLDVVDFNNSTGVVSNAKTATAIPSAYGVEFSPDDSKVYVTSNTGVFQYNATASAATFNASKIAIPTPGALNKRSLALAPNGKIYVVLEYSNYMGVINLPNNSATANACSWVANGFDLDPVNACCPANNWNLPNNYKFGNPCIPVSLAVEWLSFDTELSGENRVALNWLTASERNSSVFIIERSADGINFHEIGKKGAAGNSNKPKQYDFVDEDALTGTSYYRITEVDFDGSSFESNISVVNNAVDLDNMLHPNPANEYVWVNFPSSKKGAEFEAVIYDASGKVVQTFTKNASEQRVQLDLSSITNGVYFIKSDNSDMKLIVQH